MATVTSEVTIDTNEWVYIDKNGTPHTVTDGETFNITIENTASTITWEILAEGPTLAATSVSTTDGYTLRFRPLADGTNKTHKLLLLALADATGTYKLAGELRIECPVTGIIQTWKPAYFVTSNVDMNAAGTLGATATVWEDQFGNKMTIPGTGSGVTVAQAA